MSVPSRNRFTRAHPCPICDGYDGAPRGRGERCFGFLSDDEEWAHCTREELAGPLERHPDSQTFAHRLKGECKCGRSHAPVQTKAVLNGSGFDIWAFDATYDYRNEDGGLVFQVARYSKPEKTFRQRRPLVPNPDPHRREDWAWDVNGLTLPLYRLPDLIASEPSQPVFVVEGEKDVDRLRSLGLIATTGAMGAGKWREHYKEWLRDRIVIVLADNDEPGKRHAQTVARSVQGTAALVEVLTFRDLPDGGDISDWLNAGGSAEKLLARIRSDPPAFTRNRIISAPDLLDLELPPIRWAVNGILPEGATLYVGKAKLGKSISGLDLGIAVAFGGRAFGRLQAHQGDVLYLALEDNERRLQDRLKKMLEREGAPPNLYFVLEWPRVDEGGLDRLREWLNEHKHARMVVVDTLKMVRAKADGQQSVYDRDYESLQAFHELAQEYQVAILVLYHTRKSEADDPLDMVSGSTGLTAAADTIWVMQRRRHELDATLTVSGREVETTDVALTFDPVLLSWTYQGDAEEFQIGKERQEIIDAITAAGEPLSVRSVADALGKNFYTIKNLIHKMTVDGVLKNRPGSGYTLGDASSLRLLSGENRKNRSPRSPSPDFPHEQANLEDYGGSESRSPSVVRRSPLSDGWTTEDYGRTTARTTALELDFPHEQARNEAKDYGDYAMCGVNEEDEEDVDDVESEEEPF